MGTRARGLASRLEELVTRLEASSSPATPPRPPLVLDAELASRFVAACARRCTRKWTRTVRRLTEWWRGVLEGADLRRLSLSRILEALETAAGSRAHRIAVVKRLFSWLRSDRHELSPAEDPTLDTLHVPQATPAQWRRVRSVPAVDLRRVLRKLSPLWRARVQVLAATGWHVTELQRFAVAGRLEDRRSSRVGLVLVCPAAKGGGPRRTRVTARAWAAAREVLEAGHFDDSRFRKVLHAACEAAGVAPFGPGSLRHTVATHAVNAGAPLETVASFLGHRSPRTTARFYATHAVPRRVPTIV